MMGLQQPVALIAHDAGAANHILAWLAADDSANVRGYMEGPAKVLWNRRFPGRDLSPSIADAVAGAASVLTGSGWASDVEFSGCKAAAVAGLPCASVVDHWTNYSPRFTRDDETVLPDMIWVTDNWALEIARRSFPSVDIALQENLYLAEQLADIAARPQGNDVLYVAEPARDDWGRGVPGEFQAFSLFMDIRAKLGIPADAPVRLRPHPSEPDGKYLPMLARYKGATLSNAPDLADDIASARWVAGMQSFALTIALASGRPTYSTLPPWAPPCALPQAGIVHLRDLVAS
jgi:hypothetical protein